MAEALHHLPSTTWFDPQTGIYTSRNQHPPLPQNPHLDLVTHLFSHKHDGSIALVDASDGSSISYPNLREMVRSVSSGLHHAMRVSREDVVLMLLPNTLLFPVVYLGVLAVGAVVSPINPLSSQEEVAAHVKRCRPAMAFALPSNARRLEALGVKVVPVPEGLRFDPSAFPAFLNLISSDPRRAPRPSIRQEDTAALLCSSGTSGASKCVVLTHRNLISTVEHFARFEASQYPGEGWENVYLCALPMFHVYGLSLFATGLFSLGTKIVVLRRFDPLAAVRAIEKYGVTHAPVVPPILSALVRLQRSGAYNFSSLKQVSSGAAPISAETIREFTTVFPHVDFIQGYGMTETTAVGTRGFNTSSIRRHTSAGLLAPGMQAKIVDINGGSPLSPLGNGELWLRGPSIMKGYLNDEAATSKTINKDGWLMTGDIAHFDDDGYLHILDRLKEIIKYNGYQIAPADLEAVLMAHPDIVDVGVTAAPDEEAGEIPMAFVVRKAGSDALSATDVISYTAKKVSPYKKVRKVAFVDAIPRSPAGKILRRVLRARTNVTPSSKL